MAGVFVDEGLKIALKQLQFTSPVTIRLDTVNSAPAATDNFAGLVEPTYSGYAPITIAGLGTPGGVSGAENLSFPPVVFGPSPPGATDMVYAWAIVGSDPVTGLPMLLFRKDLSTPWDTSIPGFSLQITSTMTASTS